MKNLIYLFAASIIFTLAACSDRDQNIVSPFDTQLDKSNGSVQSFPYNLYQSFTELKATSISWQNEKEGMVIYVSSFKKNENSQLFATIDLLNGKGITMVFLGYSNSGKFIIKGVDANEVSSIRIFKPAAAADQVNDIYPYPVYQAFGELPVKGWVDGGIEAKVYSSTLPQKLNQMFAMLIAREGVQLVFLGKPDSEDFSFPKSEKLILKDIRLFTYQK